MTIREAHLVLADGSTFEGEAIGADVPVATGEIVFNTVLTGTSAPMASPSKIDPSARTSSASFTLNAVPLPR